MERAERGTLERVAQWAREQMVPEHDVVFVREEVAVDDDVVLVRDVKAPPSPADTPGLLGEEREEYDTCSSGGSDEHDVWDPDNPTPMRAKGGRPRRGCGNTLCSLLSRCYCQCKHSY